MFIFANIDKFIPYKFEKIGMLKGKRWYIDPKNNKMGLFKPQRYEFKDRKVFCANHYGELVGNILATYGGIEACEIQLAHLSRYYSNIHKERNHATPEEKNGCISYKQLKRGDILEAGKVVIEKFRNAHGEKFEELTRQNKRNSVNDNIEVVLASVEYRVREFYRMSGEYSEQYIQERIKRVRRKIIEMVVYDCLYGNYDRHDENWSMCLGANGDIDLYPLYDNEKVLGLYENQNFLEETLEKGDVEHIEEKNFSSRMIVPEETNGYSNYKRMLEYLIHTYPEETSEILEKQLKNNSLQNVQKYLESCEGLPKLYIDFGTQMYTYRNDFARTLLERNKQYDTRYIPSEER